MKRSDVAIVGAGPAGCSAAILLARKGYSVVLIDRSVFPREKPCGDFLNPVNWEIFEKLGIENALLSSAHEKVGSFRISTASATATIPFPPWNGRHFFGVGLRRSVLDDLLLRLAEKEGVAVKQGCKPSHFSRNKNDWVLTWKDSCAESKLYSRLLIGADGRNSWVAHRLGLAAPTARAGKFVAFQLHLSGCGGINDSVQIHLFPGGYGGLVGLGGGVATFCFIIDKRMAREVPAVEDLLKKYLYRNSRLEEALEGGTAVGAERSLYPVYFSPRRCYGEGYLLTGDAARVTEPVTGEGVYFALKSGELAAEVAALALRRGDVSARQLFGYELACHRVFGRRLRTNALIRAIIHRPYLIAPLLKLYPKNNLPIRTLVNLVCRASS
ncbi:MAG: NAD(P)/FAD-dependent oxidoreductase [Candidatus Binatia bacterium]